MTQCIRRVESGMMRTGPKDGTVESCLPGVPEERGDQLRDDRQQRKAEDDRQERACDDVRPDDDPEGGSHKRTRPRR